MRIVIPGGSGHVGGVLCRAFARDGHDVVVLSRGRAPAPVRTVAWDGRTLGPWVDAIEGADVVVNLAGYSVNCRYHRRNRERILRSRVEPTRVLGEALARCSKPPRTWLQASTATIYAHRYDKPNDEATGLLGGNEADAPGTWRFSTQVATAWERSCEEARLPHTRKVLLRSAITLSPERGGIFDVLLGLVRRGLGGTAGDGRQWVSWVHHEDFVRALYWLIDHEEIDGPVNVAAPGPLPNADFMRALREAWGTRIGLPAARWMLEVGAVFLRTETELVLKSRRVIPGRLLEGGFAFRHPTWPEAARALCREWRTVRGGSAAGAAAAS
ncbi:MAG TPA: TIGR01777 family oxidoreductase [Vicinamibacteria bacterium]|nr:TIGR01777 family oxidoreductase [Vicinamibacteria bacterium]